MRVANKLFTIPASILINPTAQMKAVWAWYESGDSKPHADVEDFREDYNYNKRDRTNYGQLWNDKITYTASQVNTQWAGYKSVVQIAQNLGLKTGKRVENCLQCIVLSRVDGKVDATFLMAKMNKDKRREDFYTFYKFVKKVANIIDKPVGKVSVFVAATQE